MSLHRKPTTKRLAPLAAALLVAACSATAPPRPAASARTPPQRLEHRADRVAVSIYEFRSSVDEISARGATDMFATALLASGRFQLVERARLNEGVLREKQLNAAGQSAGTSAQGQLRAAEYLFEATISELSTGDRQAQGATSIGGLQLGGSGSSDSLGIDVRIVDAGSGDVRDAVALRRPLEGRAVQVSGVGTLLQTLQGMRGRKVGPLAPDASLQASRKESVDQALRSLIDDAVAQLAARF
jgi:curli biogenesis system outer membrane secretion channel CsgG